MDRTCGILACVAVPAIRRYLLATVVGDLVWEFAQMPLYTLWRTGSPGEIAWAAVHCTTGDVAIAGFALLGALLLLGFPQWPQERHWHVAVATVAIGVGYAVFSEHLNTTSGMWDYSALMPTLPWLGTGLAPLAQWLVIPAIALSWARTAPVSGRCVTR